MDNCSSEYDDQMIAAAIRAELAAEGLICLPINNSTSDPSDTDEGMQSEVTQDVYVISDDNSNQSKLSEYTTNALTQTMSENGESQQVNNEAFDNQPSRSDTPLLVRNRTAELRENFIKNSFSNNESEPGPSNIQRCGTTAHEEMIAGVNVKLPIIPYPNQKSLIDNLIRSLKNSKNCILESPTGSGKTLALLCGVLAWQEQMKQKIDAENEECRRLREQLLLHNTTSPKTPSGMAGPSTHKQEVTPEKFIPNTFGPSTIKQEVTPEKNIPFTFGAKSICYKPELKVETSPSIKRSGPCTNDRYGECSGLVTIHKKGRYSPPYCPDASNLSNQQVTPDKNNTIGNDEISEKLRQMLEKYNGRSRSVPTVYYGTRTHTQLQQVIKEFAKTPYCSQVKMSILSSRDKTCIKKFDNVKWTTRDEMCLACKKNNTKDSLTSGVAEICLYADISISHKSLSYAFDVEEIKKVGKIKGACPYYSAKYLAKFADIVFCPYNYLIDPVIKESMQINLTGAVVVIDEAHNIEKTCREAASYDFTKDRVITSLEGYENGLDSQLDSELLLNDWTDVDEIFCVSLRGFENGLDLQLDPELQHARKYYESTIIIGDIESYFPFLIQTLRNWVQWFSTQTELRINVNNITYSWSATDFANTLEDFNIGYKHYRNFQPICDQFIKRLHENPRPLLGITKATTTFLAKLSTTLGYFFRDGKLHLNDFQPALQAMYGSDEYAPRNSSRNKHLIINSVTLHFYCLNAGIIMSSLHSAHCIALTSGTLTPTLSIAAELDTPFPHISCQASIPSNKVWVGLVNNKAYTHGNLQNNEVKEGLGRLIASVCAVTPHGVLCFVSSYPTLNACIMRWKETVLWKRLNNLKHVYIEKQKGNHEEMMKQFYKNVENKGALLLAVYRGKVSEGMDFKDHQARAVICVGIPYPYKDIAIKAKIDYNKRYHTKLRQLPLEDDWLNIDAFRAINQALGRCIRHKEDWGAVVLADSRYSKNKQYLSKWIMNIINKGENLYPQETFIEGSNGLNAFMKQMKIYESTKAHK